MANTITNVKLLNSQARAVVYMTLDSDGTDETDYVVYDSSAFIGTDPLDCTIEEISYSVSAIATVRAKLEWDATTDVLAIDLPPNSSRHFDFRPLGGLPNQGGSGKTGDILLTTVGLAAGDTITLVMKIRRD